MSATPIEAMLAEVDWTERDPSEPIPEGLYATHEGVFSIAGHDLRCYRLNNGQAVIDADDMNRFFSALGS
jgi:hypothetical protein